MSIVSNYTSEEANVALTRQRRNATISSLIIAVLVIVMIGLIMALIFLPSFFLQSPTIVTYSSNSPEDDKLTQKEMSPKIQRKPSAPSSSMAKVIASTSPSTTAIPVPEVNVPDPSVDFGSGDDFGEGWGSGGGGGGGGGGTSFFGQKSNAERIAYVIDYSLSMRGERERLMRKELGNSLKKLPNGAQYQMIFFAGPAWVGGFQVNMQKGNKEATVKGPRGHSFDWKSGGTAHDWDTKGNKQVPEWKTASDAELDKSQKTVQDTKLVWGTIWEPALEMALSMDPQPQVIYFMTDGSAGKDSGDTARKIGAKAKRKGVIINTVALMQPKAHDPMEDLAKRSGGSFTIVEKGGKVKKVR